MPLAMTADAVLRMRAKGVPYSEIAEQTGMDVRSVRRLVQDEVQRVRAELAEDVAEMFVLHNERLEALYRITRTHIDNMAVFDDRPIKVALLILERQSRLLGLDKDAKPGRGNTYDWLENATPTDLIAEAERRGIRIPEKFKLPAVMATGSLGGVAAVGSAS
jgi:hypothetical protein